MRKQKGEDRFPVFKERLNKLFVEAGGNQVQFAKHLDTSRQSLGYYLNGDRIPDAKTLAQFSSRCNVSSDWLLGLTDIRTRDADMKTAIVYTGLSEAAFDNGFARLRFDNTLPFLNTILSYLPTSKAFSETLSRLADAYIFFKVNESEIPSSKAYTDRFEMKKYMAMKNFDDVIDTLRKINDPSLNQLISNEQEKIRRELGLEDSTHGKP